MSAPIACRGLAVDIGGKRVCRDFDWAADEGQAWAVMGGNGAGKSTLLATLAGARAPAAGSVFLAGTPLASLSERERARRRALLTQHDDDPFPSTVLERVLVGRHPHLARFEWESRDDVQIARDALGAVGLSGFEGRSVTTLSGGERRRVAIAAVVAQHTPVLLLDEPAAQLDLRHQIAVLAMVLELACSQRRAAMIVSHDPNLVARFCTHALLLMGDGTVMAGKVDDVVDADTLSRMYRHPLRAIRLDGAPFFVPSTGGRDACRRS